MRKILCLFGIHNYLKWIDFYDDIYPRNLTKVICRQCEACGFKQAREIFRWKD